MARYHTILFDADQTLLDFHRSEREAITEMLLSFGLDVTEGMVADYSRINQSAWRRLELGEITKKQLRTLRFSEFCALYGFDFDAEEMATRYIAALSTKSYLIEGALECCRALAAHCRLYVITNGMAIVQHGRFDPSPLAPLFQAAFISDDIGHEKPSAAYFDYVKAHIPDFDPADTLVVGDSLSSDIKGAIGAGLDTCWYNPDGKQAPDELPITYTVQSLGEVIPLVLGA